MLAQTQSHVIALFTVRVDLLFLLLTAVSKHLPEERWAHIVAASVPVLQARGKSVGSFLATHRAQVVLYDLTSPYRANWRTLQQARQAGTLRDDQLLLLTSNTQALEAAVGPTAALEVSGAESDVAHIAGRLRELLFAAPAQRAAAR